MIVTVTLNPSLDRTLAVSSLVRGEVIRADSTLEDPAGKGVNVTRFADRARHQVGGRPARRRLDRPWPRRAAGRAGHPDRAIPIAGTTRRT